eukprot:scaffold8451_cov128-Isochrysis_galbana.AAC.1
MIQISVIDLPPRSRTASASAGGREGQPSAMAQTRRPSSMVGPSLVEDFSGGARLLGTGALGAWGEAARACALDAVCARH